MVRLKCFLLFWAVVVMPSRHALADSTQTTYSKNGRAAVQKRPGSARAIKNSAASSQGSSMRARYYPQQQQQRHPQATGVPAKVVAPVSQNNDLGWIKSAVSWIRTVRVFDAKCQSCSSFAETLALAVDRQYLIIPWRIVADAEIAGTTVRLVVDNPRVNAEVVDVDMASNLALLQVDTPLGATLDRSQIRPALPAPNETFFALSSKEWISEGLHFESARNEGASIRYAFSPGKWDHMPVSYFYDRSGKLVAFSSHVDDRDGVAPARAIQDLLSRQQGANGPHPASVLVHDQRRRQLYNWQEYWTKMVSPNKGSLLLQGMDCKPEVAAVSDPLLVAKMKDVYAFQCENKLAIPVGANYFAGLRIWQADVTLRNQKPDDMSQLVQAFAEDMFSNLDRNASLVNLMTVPECRNDQMQNSHAQKIQIRFCTSALKLEPGLNDTAVALATGDSGSQTRVLLARLKGFDQANTRKIVEGLIENVRSTR